MAFSLPYIKSQLLWEIDRLNGKCSPEELGNIIGQVLRDAGSSRASDKEYFSRGISEGLKDATVESNDSGTTECWGIWISSSEVWVQTSEGTIFQTNNYRMARAQLYSLLQALCAGENISMKKLMTENYLIKSFND